MDNLLCRKEKSDSGLFYSPEFEEYGYSNDRDGSSSRSMQGILAQGKKSLSSLSAFQNRSCSDLSQGDNKETVSSCSYKDGVYKISAQKNINKEEYVRISSILRSKNSITVCGGKNDFLRPQVRKDPNSFLFLSKVPTNIKVDLLEKMIDFADADLIPQKSLPHLKNQIRRIKRSLLKSITVDIRKEFFEKLVLIAEDYGNYFHWRNSVFEKFSEISSYVKEELGETELAVLDFVCSNEAKCFVRKMIRRAFFVIPPKSRRTKSYLFLSRASACFFFNKYIDYILNCLKDKGEFLAWGNTYGSWSVDNSCTIFLSLPEIRENLKSLVLLDYEKMAEMLVSFSKGIFSKPDLDEMNHIKKFIHKMIDMETAGSFLDSAAHQLYNEIANIRKSLPLNAN